MPTPRKRRTDQPKRVQLFKASRELNIATDTIVSALTERGFELDDKLAAGDPNGRLSPEMYDVLIETYSDDADAKARVRERRQQLASAEAEADEPAEAVSAEPPTPIAEAPVACRLHSLHSRHL